MKAKIALLTITMVVMTSCIKFPFKTSVNTTIENPPITLNTTTSTTTETQNALESDFTPTQGKLELTGEGPWDKRILFATSTDGLTFTKTDTVFADQANTPNMVVDARGWIYLYYSGWTVGTKNNSMGVGISQDNGTSWIHKYVQLEGFENMANPNDPDVVLLEDGTFRLFVTSNEPNEVHPKIFYADGTDGINFTKGGVAFSDDNEWAMDSSTFKIGDEWHQLSLIGNAMEHFHAMSTDGKNFTFVERTYFTHEKKQYIMANEIETNDGVRFYAFNLGDKSFRSFLSSDGTHWTFEDGTRLDFDESTGLESRYIKDPAVVQLQDGTYLMAYVTVVP